MSAKVSEVEEEKYYSKAANCRFFPVNLPRYSIRLPAGATWDYSPDLLRFSFDGRSYLLGLNPQGYLQGFASREPEPADRAALCILTLDEKGAKKSVVAEAGKTPAAEIQELIRESLNMLPPGRSV